jgi:hypothetical protein
MHKIPHEQSGHYTIYESQDIEFTDPTKHFSEIHLIVNYELNKKLLNSTCPEFPPKMIDSLSYNQAIEQWQTTYHEYLSLEIPIKLLTLLTSDSKKDQVHLLKGLSMSPDQLVAFILRAYKDFGYLFSQYSAEFHTTGLNKKNLPIFAELDGEIVNKIGETSLTDNQIKHAIKFRNVVVAKFLDNGQIWHCFFLTYKSIFGKEGWQNGQPHLHYISNKFGLSRERVVKELKNKEYKLGNLPHIGFINYRDK